MISRGCRNAWKSACPSPSMASPRPLRGRPSAPIHGRGRASLPLSPTRCWWLLTSVHGELSRASGGRSGCRRWAGRGQRLHRCPSLSTVCAHGAGYAGNVHGWSRPAACAREAAQERHSSPVVACGDGDKLKAACGGQERSPGRGSGRGLASVAAAPRRLGGIGTVNGQSGPRERPRLRRGIPPPPPWRRPLRGAGVALALHLPRRAKRRTL